jgi:hypothetical protein
MLSHVRVLAIAVARNLLTKNRKNISVAVSRTTRRKRVTDYGKRRLGERRQLFTSNCNADEEILYENY